MDKSYMSLVKASSHKEIKMIFILNQGFSAHSVTYQSSVRGSMVFLIMTFLFNHKARDLLDILKSFLQLAWGYQASSDLVNQFRFQFFSSFLELLLRAVESIMHICVSTVKLTHSLLSVAEPVWASVSATASPTPSHSRQSLWCTVTPACRPRHSGKW